jgi:hypothetical protein
MKQGCSLMPPNPNAQKTNLRALAIGYLLAFRTNQAQEKHATKRVKKANEGKQRVHNSPGADKPEASTSGPSPLELLASLRELILGSDESTAANTPASSPAISLQLPLPERSAPAPSTTPKARPVISKRSISEFISKAHLTSSVQQLAGFAVEAPAPRGSSGPHVSRSHALSATRRKREMLKARPQRLLC